MSVNAQQMVEINPKSFTLKHGEEPLPTLIITFKNLTAYQISITVKNGTVICEPFVTMRGCFHFTIPPSPTAEFSKLPVEFQVQNAELTKFSEIIRIKWIRPEIVPEQSDGMSLPDSCKCGICMESYDEAARAPRILLCGHTYCHQCLSSIYEETRNKANIKCPECRQATTVPKQHISNISKNYTLLSLIKDLSEPPKKKQRMTSSENDSADNESTILLPRCPRHPKNFAEFLCKDVRCHNKLAKEYCRLCLSENHIGHDSEHLSQVLTYSKTEARPLIGNIHEKLDKVDELLEDRNRQLIAHGPNGPLITAQKKAIEEYFDRKKALWIQESEKFVKAQEDQIKSNQFMIEADKKNMEKAVQELEIATSAETTNLAMIQDAKSMAMMVLNKKLTYEDKFPVVLFKLPDGKTISRP